MSEPAFRIAVTTRIKSDLRYIFCIKEDTNEDLFDKLFLRRMETKASITGERNSSIDISERAIQNEKEK